MRNTTKLTDDVNSFFMSVLEYRTFRGFELCDQYFFIHVGDIYDILTIIQHNTILQKNN